jgi:RNA polymerase sigma factor (sigma-70 family)
MNSGQLVAMLQHFRRLTGVGEIADLSDRQLLERYAVDRDEMAFAALLQRHGCMVWNVCRCVLSDCADADDAFQATFLVLIHKATTLSGRESLAAWLQGVAWRVARKVKAEAARRCIKESRAEREDKMDFMAEMERRDLRALLDEELDRLPEKYRAPLVLCYLEGMSYTEAARQLGWRDGTVCGRLARARELLRQRLSRRGLALSGAALTAALTEPASAPATTVAAVSRMAALFALGQMAAGSISPPVATLAQGVLQAMSVARLRTMAVLVAAFCLVASGGGLAAHRIWTTKESPPRTDTPIAKGTKQPSKESRIRTDLHGDPLPAGALLRMGTVRFRSGDCIGQIAYSPDGKILAAGGYHGKIYLYDAATGRKLRQWDAFASEFPSLAFAPDGKTLASAGSRTIQIWDMATGKELHRFEVKVDRPVHDHYLKKIAPLVFSHDGKSLAWVAADRSIRLWDAQTGKESAKLTGHQEPIRCLAFSTDDRRLFSAGGNAVDIGTVRIWQLPGGKELRQFSLHRRQASAQPDPLCFSPDGKALAVAVHEWLPPKKGANAFLNAYAITFMDLETGKENRKLEAQPGRMKAASFSPDGKTLAAMQGVETIVGNHHTDINNRLLVWDIATGKLRWDAPAYAENLHQGPCHLVFSPDGKKLAASATASSLHVWEVARGREGPELAKAHDDKTDCVVFSPDGRTLASGSADHTISLWDASSGKQRLRLYGHKGDVSALAFSPDGKLLASASRFDDQTVRLWNLATGKELRQYFVPSVPEGNGTFLGVATWVAFMANGKILAAAGTDRKVRLWDVATGKELLNRVVRGLPLRSKQGADAGTDFVQEVAYTPDGRTMALTIGGKNIHVADVAAGQRLFQFGKDGNTTAHLALSPDGKTLLCGGRSRSFRLVEIASGKDSHKIDVAVPKNDEILALASAPDGRTVAVAAGHFHGWIYLFDVPTGKQLLHLQGAASRVNGLAFSPDGNKLASAQNDATALVWDVSAARRNLPAPDLIKLNLDRLWKELKDDDAPKAHAALWSLVAAPDKAVPFLKEHLHAVPRVPPDRLRQLIADLDADDFARREEASRGLAKLGIEAEPALRKALEDKPSLEMRRRAEALLKDLSCQTEMTAEALRQLRAIQVLEQIGSPEARQILTTLVQGAPAAPATRDAVAALQRLHRRTSKP